MSATTTTPEEALRLWREKLSSPKPIPVFEFDPPEPIIERIISDLNDKRLSFAQVAERANTTTEALSIWLVRPDIALRMDAMESMCNRRARIQIVNHVDAMIDTCATVMERYCRAPDRGLSLVPDPKSHAICTRNTSNALMATRIMMHMKRFFDDAPRARRSTAAPHNPDPTPPPPTPTTPNATAPDRSTRIGTFPRLQDPSLNLHDERAANHTINPNPQRDNSLESLSR